MVDKAKQIAQYDNQIYHCTKCGLCQAVCPVFEAVKSEYSVSRGKIALMQALLSGKLEYSHRMASYMELCTGCAACQEHCPSGVSSEKVFLAAKVFAAEKYGLSLPKQAIVHAFASEKALNFFSTMLNLYTTVKAGYIADYAPNSIPFVDKIKLLNLLVKDKTSVKFDGLHIKQEHPAYKLLYFPGCINKHVNPDVGNATLNILKNNNCEVFVPEGQYCCGSPPKSVGAVDVTKVLAELNLKAFDVDLLKEYDYIIVDCASCGSMLKNYHEYFEDDPQKHDHSLILKDKVIDINAFLTTIDFKMPDSDHEIIVTYHDPCHLRRAQNVYKQPREIIKRIPGVTLVEMHNSDSCCGAAGSFCITNMKVSQSISNKKAEHILETKADFVLTSCPSCKIGITQGLLHYDKPMNVYHPVELIHKLNKKR